MQELLKGLTARLDICATRMGSKRALALASGVSEAQLYRYMDDGTAIPAERLVAMANAAGVDAGWLLTGDGKMDISEDSLRSPFSPALLIKVNTAFEEALIEYEKRVPPALRGALLAHIYETLRMQELRSGQAPVMSKVEMMCYLDYLLVAPHEEYLQWHRLAMDTLEGYAPLPDVWDRKQVLHQWVQAVSQSYRQYFNQTRGRIFFNVVGFEVGSNAAQRLHAMMAALQDGKAHPNRMKMLEIGCGNGRELAFLLQHYPWLEGVGIEISEMGVELARSLEKSGRIPADTVRPGNMLNLPFGDELFDFVYSRQAFFATPYIPGEEMGAVRALREIRRVLKPGGTLHIASLRGNGRDYLPLLQYYERGTFEALLAEVPGLTLVDWQEPAPPAQVWHPTESRYTTYFLATIKKDGQAVLD